MPVKSSGAERKLHTIKVSKSNVVYCVADIILGQILSSLGFDLSMVQLALQSLALCGVTKCVTAF